MVARQIRDPRSRELIIAAGWRLISTRGAAAATMRTIAAEAGVTTGSVTHYFEDKAELLGSIQRYNGRLAAERVRVSVGSRRGLAAVRRAALGLLPTDVDGVAIWRVWLAFWSDDPRRSPTAGGFGSGYRAWGELARKHLEEAVDNGELRAGLDLRHEVSRLVTLVAGMGLLSGSDPETRDRLRRRANRMLTEHFDTLRADVPVS